MKKLSHLLVVSLALVCLIATASAQTTIIESRAAGANFTQSGWATSSGSTGAEGTTPLIGSWYSGTTVYFGPTRYAQFSFVPSISGSYNIELAWPSTAGQIATAVNLYTGAATGNATPDIWGNTGGPQGVLFSGTMDMYYRATTTWNMFTTENLSSGTTYNVGIYGGYKTPYAGGVTPEDLLANRVSIAAVKFTLVPEPSSLALALLGGFGLFFARMRRQ